MKLSSGFKDKRMTEQLGELYLAYKVGYFYSHPHWTVLRMLV